MNCPACSAKSKPLPDHFVYRCTKCDAIFSNNMILGDSYKYVSARMTDEDVPEDRLRYFDFTCIGSKGVTRRHGWFDRITKLVVQVG